MFQHCIQLTEDNNIGKLKIQDLKNRGKNSRIGSTAMMSCSNYLNQNLQTEWENGASRCTIPYMYFVGH